MTAYTKQSRKPKPAKPQDIIDRFVRDMEAAGMNASAVYNIGSPYMPSVVIEIWPKKAADKEASN